MKLRDQIAAEIEAFLDKTGMPAATFGRNALNDPTFVFEVREGRDIKSRTIDTIREYMADYRPKRANQAGNGHRAAA